MSEVARAKAQAKRRAKLMEDSEAHEKYVEKECNVKLQRGQQQGEKEEHRLQERIRVRDCRAKKKSQSQEGSQPSTSTPYRTSQALGKAMKRAQTSLPISPSKRLCVVKVALANESSPATSTTHNARSLSEETEQLVLNFYNTDDVTWQAPGRKDRIITLKRLITSLRRAMLMQKLGSANFVICVLST